MTATRATSRPASRVFAGPKVPEVFVVFWVVKLLTTGIGETAADFMGTANLVLAGVVGIGGFFAALWLQLRADRYRPVLYWVTVLMVAVFGTMIADGPHVALGTPYYVDSASTSSSSSRCSPGGAAARARCPCTPSRPHDASGSTGGPCS